MKHTELPVQVADETVSGADCAERCSCSCGSALPTTDRRAFLTGGAAALAMLALSACGLSSSPTAPSSLPSTTVSLTQYPALQNVGGVAVVRVGGAPVALVRESTSTISAFSLICPHAGSTVQPYGSQGFYCPGHGAQFNLQGQWIGGQRTSNLRTYPSTYDAAAGTVTVGS